MRNCGIFGLISFHEHEMKFRCLLPPYKNVSVVVIFNSHRVGANILTFDGYAFKNSCINKHYEIVKWVCTVDATVIAYVAHNDCDSKVTDTRFTQLHKKQSTISRNRRC